MPSVSKVQKRFMAAASHSPEFAKKVGVDPIVAEEFNNSDAGTSDKKLPERKSTTESHIYKWGRQSESN